MPVSHIAFTMYPVTDVPRAVAFYRDVLGLQPSGPGQPFWVEFDIAGNTFGIGNFEQVGKPGTAHALALEISDMPAFRAELTAKGVESTEPFETAVCFISIVKDPDGNHIALHQAKAT